ncbi:VanW family protein [Clostridium sp. D2Q-11]|uniref:VanW family protein n=1 Tax=Anaeromonas frigoriresistens TaxID=2683708 RepID=A0A942UZ41_9FIRM|nr:VanW family protein [Anaeromonas frigoriresistens]
MIFWITLHSPLKITERYRHSYDVFPDSNRTQPFGSGATCVYNYRDLQLYNDTDEEYQIVLYMDVEYLHGEIRSNRRKLYNYEIYEKEHKITHEHWVDYVRHNLIYRKRYDLEGDVIDDEYITENHALMMYQPFLEQQV